MKLKFLKYLRCPACETEVVLENDLETLESAKGEIMEDQLLCKKCGSVYPVKKGIPRLVPEENYANTFGFQWNRHAKAQIDKFNGLSISQNRFFSETCWPKNMEGKLILEAGSGAGRFTQIACETGAEVISFDYSSAVEANFQNNKEYKNLHIFQGDIFHIPLQKASFDKVFCFGVLQHTPDPRKAFMSLSGFVKPGGELAVDIYSNRLTSLISWKYLLRPITKKMDKAFLYKIIHKTVPVFLPFSNMFQKAFGKIGVRLLPIANYSRLGFSAELNREWSILDTFDMYSPAHDHPQSKRALKSWFESGGFDNIMVDYGSNGIVGRGRKKINVNFEI